MSTEAGNPTMETGNGVLVRTDVDMIDLTIDEKISKRAIPDFSKLRGPIYQLYNWCENERMWKCTNCK